MMPPIPEVAPSRFKDLELIIHYDDPNVEGDVRYLDTKTGEIWIDGKLKK